MQTFLPFPDVVESSHILDKRRIWKQTVEAAQLIKALNEHTHWSNHTACIMWKGYEVALKRYFNVFLERSIEVGIKVKKYDYFDYDVKDLEMPWWFGNEEFHRRHRIALLTKKPEHYNQFGWKEKPDENYKYFWPVRRCHYCYGTGHSSELCEDMCSCCRGKGLLRIKNDGITPIIEFAK